MDEVTWGALTLVLTLLGGFWTWYAWRRRGLASGVRGAAVTLLAPAAWLTGTLEMFTEIAGSVGDWAASLVLSPTVWLGIVLAGTSAVLFGISGALRSRGRGGPPRARAAGSRPRSGRLGPGRTAPPALDDDMADVEALLRRRGIT